jgi:hypothetical protein
MQMKQVTVALALMVATLVTPLKAADKTSINTTQIPVTGAAATGEKFAGTFTLLRFATDDAGKLVAVGTIAGALTDASGQALGSAFQTVALPVVVNGGGQAVQTAVITPQAVSCGILHLDLGPLSLNLLGLQVNLSRVVLDITAVPGAGNLLGNLLCSVANLLNNPGALAQLLNQILAILQGL